MNADGRDVLGRERKREIMLARMTALSEQRYESGVLIDGLLRQNVPDRAALERTGHIVEVLDAQIAAVVDELERIRCDADQGSE